MLSKSQLTIETRQEIIEVVHDFIYDDLNLNPPTNHFEDVESKIDSIIEQLFNKLENTL